jgi:hypothetical protein
VYLPGPATQLPALSGPGHQVARGVEEALARGVQGRLAPWMSEQSRRQRHPRAARPSPQPTQLLSSPSSGAYNQAVEERGEVFGVHERKALPFCFVVGRVAA